MNKFFIELSPFTISVTSDISLVKTNLETLYPDSIFLDENKNHLIDYHVSSNFSSLIRKFIKPQSVFAHDGFEPFMGLPLNHAYASLEWGINYVVATNALEYTLSLLGQRHRDSLQRTAEDVALGRRGPGNARVIRVTADRSQGLSGLENALLSRPELQQIGQAFGAAVVDAGNNQVEAVVLLQGGY